MRNLIVILTVSLLALYLSSVNAGATVIINSNGFPYYGDSWDSPSDEIQTVLAQLESDIYGGPGDVHLNIVNYGVGDILETWSGIGVQSVILEEIAGYSNKTTFGWYDVESNVTEQIFSGSDGKGTASTTTFGAETHFGFYIDPNGVSENRMFSEHDRNTHDDYQVVIFEIAEAENQYILGWEDLDLNGDSGGDRDYQDMVIRATINPVPEPSTMLLLGTALAGFAGTRIRKKFRK